MDVCNLQPSGLQQHSSEHVISRSKQLLLAVFLQKAHLNPFKSKAVTVSTVHYRHSSMASASMLRCPAQQGGSVKWAHSNTNMQPTACSLQEGQKQRGAREAPQSFSLVWRVQTLPPLQIKAFLLVWMLCLLAESGMRKRSDACLVHPCGGCCCKQEKTAANVSPGRPARFTTPPQHVFKELLELF